MRPERVQSVAFTAIQLLGAVAAVAGALQLFGLAWTLLGVGVLVLVGASVAEALAGRPPSYPRRYPPKE